MAEAPSSTPKVDGRSLRYADRRRELLHQSTAYVLEHGLSDLSMRPLAKALGITHTSLSAHFGSKENLIVEILATLREVSQRSRRMPPPRTAGDAGAAGADGTPAEGPFLRYDRWWRNWTQEPFLPAIRLTFEVFGLALQHPEKYRDFLDHAVSDWLEVLRPVLRDSGCPTGELDVVATSAVAHMIGLQADLLATGDRARVDAAHEDFMQTLEAKARRWVAPGAPDAT